MLEILISFKTAVLAKQKGFDFREEFFYDNKGNLYKLDTYLKKFENKSYLFDENIEFCQAPSKNALQKYLRYIFKIFITIELDRTLEPKWCYVIDTYFNKQWNNHFVSDLFYTYEEALEEGIYQGLKLIEDEH